MRASKRILNVRKQSRITLPKENLWFFSEDSAVNQTPDNEKQSFRRDRLSVLKEDDDRYSLENSGRSRSKKHTFVVDWQMSDAF